MKVSGDRRTDGARTDNGDSLDDIHDSRRNYRL